MHSKQPHRKASGRFSSSSQLVLLTGVTLLAVVLRFYKLGEWSFWVDEISMIGRAVDFPNIPLFSRSATLAVMHYFLNWSGVDEWSARLIPSLIGMISIPVLYFPIRKIFDPWVALISVLLLAVSPWHLYWSQNARFYTSLLLFFNLSLLFFYLGMEKDRLWYLILSICFLGLAFFERHIALFLGPVMVGYLVLLKLLSFELPVGLRFRNIGVLSLPVLVCAPIAAPAFFNMTVDFVESYAELAQNSPFWTLAGSLYYIGIPTLIAGCLGLVFLYLQKNRAFLILGLGALIPMAATFVLSFFTYTANRYIFISLVCWLVLAAVGAAELIKQSQGTVRFLAAGMLLVLFFVPMSENTLYYQYQNGNRANWRAAVELVKQRKEDGDRVVSSKRAIAEYYLGEHVTSYNFVDLPDLDKSQTKVWFIVDNSGEVADPKFTQWIRRNATLVEVFDTHVEARNFRMRVYRYDPGMQ